MKREELKPTVDNCQQHAYKAEIFQAQIRQKFVTEYPSRSVKSGGLFDEGEFGLEGQKFENNRVAWIDVPHGMTIAQVEERLAKFPNARVQRHLSSKPLVDKDLKWALVNEKCTMEDIKERQVVKDKDENVILYNGHPIYKKHTFSAIGAEDIDEREPRDETIDAAVEQEVDSLVEQAKSK